jgi:peptidoglycan biosynthesis protein MviN/MurJ (putative lipid II flippase)
MIKFINIKSAILLFTCIITVNGETGINPFENAIIFYQEVETPTKVFAEIETGISNGNVSAIAAYFSSQNYLSLSTGISGYYSANQSYYVLEDYFNFHRPVSFKFTSIRGTRNAYATGTLVYELHNRKKTALVFISLESTDNTWKISQITIK